MSHTLALIGGALCLLAVGAAVGAFAVAYHFGKGWMR